MANVIQAVIFDMDGLMIDSEPLWHIAEKEVFKTVGIILEEEDCLETTGLRVDEVVQHNYEKFKGWDEGIKSKEQLSKEIIQRMEKLLQAEASSRAKPGLREAIEFFDKRNLPLAVASSSPKGLIDAALVGLRLKDKFQSIYSAHDEQFGKPHPAVYLSASKGLGVQPWKCLALEDSLNGTISAKAAKMKVFSIPERFQDHHLGFHIADAVIRSLEMVEETFLGRF